MPTEPISYELTLMAKGEDSLFVINWGDVGLPLGELRLANEEGEVLGTEWERAVLSPGECVALWKDIGDPKAPGELKCDVDDEQIGCEECSIVGEPLGREGKDRFWKKKFDVYYGEEKVGNCKEKPKKCIVTFSNDGQ
jgi:hypothetical protein